MKHQYNFDIEIPEEVITRENHDKIDYELLDNKIIIGLIGYAKSGKDFIAKSFIDKHKFHRVAFADNIKIEMNKHIKESVYNDIFKSDEPIHFKLEDVDFFTEELEIKRHLRPYIIWYGEKLREINGPYYWVNKAFKVDASGHDKIILSDVRRKKELEVFADSNSQAKRTRNLFAEAGCFETPHHNVKSYSSLLFYVTQKGIIDNDILTIECVKHAVDNWLIDDTFYVDPRLPKKGGSRKKAISTQVRRISKEFGIKTPEKHIAQGRQMTILD